MRFSPSPHERADAIATLTLVRALTHHLIETGRTSPAELELISASALEELATGSAPVIEEARKLVEQEYP